MPRCSSPCASIPAPSPAERSRSTLELSRIPALIRAADRVCVLSPDHADSVSYLKRTGERDPEKLIEMPNGVDAERFSPGSDATGFRERLGIPADAIVAAFVATLDRAHHFKRLDVAIDDNQVEKVVDAISNSAKTGQIGDGKIFVHAIERAVRIRTGETDTDAL